MREVQKQVDEWVRQYTIGYWQPADIMLRVTEEVGELAREVNHHFGPKKKKQTEGLADLEEEMADIIFTLACLANSLNLDLERGFEKVMKKINSRDKDRWEKKDA